MKSAEILKTTGLQSLQDYRGLLGPKRNRTTQRDSLHLSRSNSLPTQQRQPMLLQRNAVAMLNEFRNESKQKPTADALMRSDASVQQRHRSCAAAPRKSSMQTKRVDTDALLVGECLHLLLCATKRGNAKPTRINLVDTQRFGKIDTDSSTTPTTCPCSPSTSRCSSPGSSLVRHASCSSYVKPEDKIPHALKLHALLDKDGDRLVDKEEWSLFFEIASERSVFRDVLYSLFKAADVDEDGMLDEHEWVNYVEGIIAKIGVQAWGEMARRVQKGVEKVRRDEALRAKTSNASLGPLS